MFSKNIQWWIQCKKIRGSISHTNVLISQKVQCTALATKENALYMLLCCCTRCAAVHTVVLLCTLYCATLHNDVLLYTLLYTRCRAAVYAAVLLYTGAVGSP